MVYCSNNDKYVCRSSWRWLESTKSCVSIQPLPIFTSWHVACHLLMDGLQLTILIWPVYISPWLVLLTFYLSGAWSWKFLFICLFHSASCLWTVGSHFEELFRFDCLVIENCHALGPDKIIHSPPNFVSILIMSMSHCGTLRIIMNDAYICYTILIYIWISYQEECFLLNLLIKMPTNGI